MSDLTLYHLPPSPNNIKVRLALGLKKIDCQLKAINPMDRSEVLEVSGQPLTPVLEDGDRVVFDSSAILRYLDANWRESGPRLFSTEREGMYAIEDWERYTKRDIGQSVGMIFSQAFAEQKDDAVIKQANDLLAEKIVRVEEALKDQDYLMGDTPNAADLTCAPFVAAATQDPAQVPADSIQAFFANSIQLPQSFEKTHAWVKRVMALDVAQ